MSDEAKRSHAIKNWQPLCNKTCRATRCKHKRATSKAARRAARHDRQGD